MTLLLKFVREFSTALEGPISREKFIPISRDDMIYAKEVSPTYTQWISLSLVSQILQSSIHTFEINIVSSMNSFVAVTTPTMKLVLLPVELRPVVLDSIIV